MLSFFHFGVPYNYTESDSRQIERANLSSVAVCSAGRSMGITVNTLYFSCWCCGLFVADVGARRLLSCGPDQGCAPPRGLTVDRSLFKVIRVTVRAIDTPLLLLCSPDRRLRSALSDPACLNGKNIAERSADQKINGFRAGNTEETQRETAHWRQKIRFCLEKL